VRNLGLGAFLLAPLKVEGVLAIDILTAALAIWLLVGLAFPIALGPIHAIYQSSVPAEMQGRFYTLNDAVVRAMSPLGLAVAGPLADAFGVRPL
jgi:DHA3 family macrolide efflux protein-like MFS transporter